MSSVVHKDCEWSRIVNDHANCVRLLIQEHHSQNNMLAALCFRHRTIDNDGVIGNSILSS